MMIKEVLYVMLAPLKFCKIGDDSRAKCNFYGQRIRTGNENTLIPFNYKNINVFYDVFYEYGFILHLIFRYFLLSSAKNLFIHSMIFNHAKQKVQFVLSNTMLAYLV